MILQRECVLLMIMLGVKGHCRNERYLFKSFVFPARVKTHLNENPKQ